MKKIIYLICTAFFSLIILLCGYFWYQKKQSQNILVYNETKTLIKLDTYRLVKKFISNQRYLPDSLTNVNSLIGTVDIPADIFLFTVDGKKETTIFGSLNIKDYKLFHKYVTTHLDLENDKDLSSLYSSKDRKWKLLYNKNTVVFAYSATKEKVSDILKELILKKNTVKIKESPFKNILNKKGEIVFYNLSSEGSIHWKDSAIKGEIKINSHKFSVSKPIKAPVFSKDNFVSLWLNADISSYASHKSFKIGEYRLNTDSILPYFKNEVQVEIKEPVQQKEQQISYEYDDNFEKVEVIKEKINFVPGFNVKIKSDAYGLKTYLTHENILLKNGEISREFFPLFKIEAQSEPDYLVLSTVNNAVFAPKISSDVIFYMKVNFDKMRTQKEFSDYKAYMKNLKRLEIITHYMKENKLLVNFSIESENNDVFFLISWLSLISK
ncbi:hypothetical protein O2K51_07395 [Apibacter raozihei]|uniref:hypothetical protein n=1 Tax=Apibacter raozihei TaxID=2500547 RepID=UPI000FE32AFE|nr:hypothetical protein [Apibacter raozihei]